MMKIGLGTAQFGMKYGISSPCKVVDDQEMAAILDLAVENSAVILDTSPAYGNAEERLGGYRSIEFFDCVTKTVTGRHRYIDESHVSRMVDHFEASVASLKLPSVYGLLVHDCHDLICDGSDRLFDALLSLKERGLVKKIGVSVYLPEEADAILSRYDLDLLQVPLNPLNQSFLEGDCLGAISAMGVEVHARSLFLQGLLLLSSENFPRRLSPLADAHECFINCAKELGVTPLQLALNFALGQLPVQSALVGVENLTQFREILHAVGNPIDLPDISHLHVPDPDWNNPAKWPK